MITKIFVQNSILKNIILFVLVGFCNSNYAQQDAQFSMPYYNQMFFNPATTGFRGCVSASINARAQWIGLKGAPVSWSFGIDIPFIFGKTRQNCIGFGVSGNGDYSGFSQSNGLKFSLSYRRMKLGPGDLSIGIDLGLATKAIVNAVWITPTGLPDPGLPPSNAAADAIDMGAGIYYAGDNFYAGISTTHLNTAKFSTLNTRFVHHMYFNGGGFIPIGVNKNWRLNPNGIIRTDFATMNFDIGLNALCYIKENNGIIFGTAYRFIDAVCFNIGYAHKIKKGTKGMFMISYNIDLVTSRLSIAGPTSHELVLRFCFPSKDSKLQRIFF